MFLPQPNTPHPHGVGTKFILFVPLHPRMPHIKNGQNWPCGFREEVEEALSTASLQTLIPPGVCFTPWGPNPRLNGHEFHNFCKGHTADHYYAYSLAPDTLGVKKKIFESCPFFKGFCPTPQPPWGVGARNSQFLFPLTQGCHRPKMVKIG